jgi:predicted Fe-S protein YdhL (DUF1289 family)
MSLLSEHEPVSPCIRVCTLNPHTGWCEGCLRTIDEIAAWASYSSQEKCAVLAKLEERCLRLMDEALCS